MKTLAEVRDRLLRLPGVKRKIAQRAAGEFAAMAEAAFDGQRDPYGKPWGPNRNADVPDLVESGSLRAGVTQYKVIGDGIVQITMQEYGRYQNPRRFLPRKRDLPPDMLDAVERLGIEIVTEMMS